MALQTKCLCTNSCKTTTRLYVPNIKFQLKVCIITKHLIDLQHPDDPSNSSAVTFTHRSIPYCVFSHKTDMWHRLLFQHHFEFLENDPEAAHQMMRSALTDTANGTLWLMSCLWCLNSSHICMTATRDHHLRKQTPLSENRYSVSWWPTAADISHEATRSNIDQPFFQRPWYFPDKIFPLRFIFTQTF